MAKGSARPKKADSPLATLREPAEFVRFLALRLLAEGPVHGYEIIRAFARAGFGGSAGASIIYPTLGRFLAEGLVTMRPMGRRKVYEITAAGRSNLSRRKHPHLEKVFSDFSRSQIRDPEDITESEAHFTQALSVVRDRGTTNDQREAAKIVAKAAAALRRVIR